MAAIVAFVSQKGGVGKSTLARSLAALAAGEGINVRLADLDWKQQTAKHWSDVRAANEVEPAIDCRVYESAFDAIADADGVDLLVIDQPGYASGQTADLARHADLVIEPTGPSNDDMRPGVLVLHELVEEGIAEDKLAVALFRVGTAAEEKRARSYMSEYYNVLDGYMPEMPSMRQAQDKGLAVSEFIREKGNAPGDQLMGSILAALDNAMERSAGAQQEPQAEAGSLKDHMVKQRERGRARAR